MSDGVSDYARNMDMICGPARGKTCTCGASNPNSGTWGDHRPGCAGADQPPQPKTATRSMEEMGAEINERLKGLRAAAETTREAFAVGDVPKLLEEIEFLGLIHNRLHSVVVDYMRSRTRGEVGL